MLASLPGLNHVFHNIVNSVHAMDVLPTVVPEQYRVTPKDEFLAPEAMDTNASIDIKVNALRLLKWCRATTGYFKDLESTRVSVQRYQLLTENFKSL